MIGIVYILIDPRDSRIRYVGQTTQAPAKRLRAHCNASKKQRSHLARWVACVLRDGRIPQIVPVAVAETRQRLNDLEIAFIDVVRGAGAKLVNATPGGEGGSVKGRVLSSETRRRMSEAHRGLSIAPETRAKISAAQRSNTVASRFTSTRNPRRREVQC